MTACTSGGYFVICHPNQKKVLHKLRFFVPTAIDGLQVDAERRQGK
jgi:hypothetical protein